MSDNSVIEINDDADIDKINVDKNDVDKIDVDKIDVDKIDVDKIIDVDKNEVDKIFTFDDIGDEPHSGKPITMIEISPKETYLITYSKEDRSIAGWNVEDIDKIQLKFDQTIKIIKINRDNTDTKYEIESLCVSDDKKLTYIICRRGYYFTTTVIDMNNKDKKITLNLNVHDYYYCTFNLNGELILYNIFHYYRSIGYQKIIWIYSTQTKNNTWECKRFYRIPEVYDLISISKYDNVYLVLNDYIYEWNINTEKRVKIFGNNKDKNKFKTNNIGIFSNEKFIFLKINDKIIVYSIELRTPIASLDINDDIQLYNFMNRTGLFLLPSYFCYVPDKGIWNSIKYCWNNKYKNRFNQTLLPTDKSTDESTDDQTKFVFGILNERIWKSKFDEKMSKTKENNKIVECDEYSNIHLFNLYMDTVTTLFQKAVDSNNAELAGNLIKWDISIENDKINLAVFNKCNTEWNLIGKRIENFHYPYKDFSISNDHKLIVSSLFDNNNIAILTTFGILVYTFSENNKSVTLIYFYFMKFDKYRFKYEKKYMKILQHYRRLFSKSTLLSSNYDSFRLDGWVSDAKNNKLSLLKNGVELFAFAIKEHKLELIDDIYKKCMIYFKEDSMNNKSFLSIITSTMPLLDKYYPEYILRYSSETNMIIDSSFYHIEHQNKNLHLCSFFQSPQLANLSRSLLWTKYYYKFYSTFWDADSRIVIIIIWIIWVIQALIILLTLPLYLTSFYILSKYNFINNIYTEDSFSFVYFYIELKIFKFFKKNITTIPTITFMIPYINFVNYSKDYSWFLELIRPQPSPFTETINRNIYKTWNGEALINFKWNAYGKYYYAMIWVLFMALLGCFTAAATIPQKYINEE
ncbi:hypothetical protein C1646_767540, partial [Rhizophagus diaphanus]